MERKVRGRRQVVSVVGVALVMALGCGGQEPFPGAARTLDELGEGVLAAFRTNDHKALEGFRLSENEHNQVVWPELPASQGENPYPLDLAWQNIQLRNQRAILRLAQLLQGVSDLEYEALRCEGTIETFESFTVHTDCYVYLHDLDRRYRIQLFKDVLQRNGGYKLFRYYDEDLDVVKSDDR